MRARSYTLFAIVIVCPIGGARESSIHLSLRSRSAPIHPFAAPLSLSHHARERVCVHIDSLRAALSLDVKIDAGVRMEDTGKSVRVINQTQRKKEKKPPLCL